MSFSIKARMSAISWRICAQRSIPNPKAKPDHSVGVDADGREDRRVDHPAPAELDPAGARARPAAAAVADGAGDLVLGRRLGEGEVGRPQPRVDVGAEVGGGERLDGAGQVGERDAPVDHQALDLVEHRQVAGVGGVAAVAAPRHDRSGSGATPAATAASMSRIWTGEVWVRSTTVSGSPSVQVEAVVHRRAPGGPGGC